MPDPSVPARGRYRTFSLEKPGLASGGKEVDSSVDALHRTVAAEQGLVGLVAYVWVVAAALWALFGDRAWRAVRERGWRPVLWSRWGRDWRGAATGRSIARLATGSAREGDVVLLHDSDCYSTPGSWARTLAALPIILEELGSRGLKIAALRR